MMCSLKEFIGEFVEPNTLIRLWYKTKSGHELVTTDQNPRMEHQWVQSYYKFNVVIGVTDIVIINEPHKEAVNISIER